MTGTSNFITDLLDQMKSKNVVTLFLMEDRLCFYQKANASIVDSEFAGRPCIEELQEDLGALGFTLKPFEDYYYRYDPNGVKDNESIFFNVTMLIGNYGQEIIFRFMQTHSGIIRELQHANPITSDEYHEYAY